MPTKRITKASPAKSTPAKKKVATKAAKSTPAGKVVLKKKPVKKAVSKKAIVKKTIVKAKVKPKKAPVKAVKVVKAVKAAAVPAPAPNIRPASSSTHSAFMQHPANGSVVPLQQNVRCVHCKKEVQLRKCQVQKCKNMIVPGPTRKLCAECMFERNIISMTEFAARQAEEMACPTCGNNWQSAAVEAVARM